MRYKIKIKTYGSGRQEFYPFFKKGFRWMGIASDGSLYYEELSYHGREDALYVIDKHYKGNGTLVRIDVEYITK